MRLLQNGLALCTVCVVAAGCASAPGRAVRSPDADKIAVYDTVPPGTRPYRLVKRVWVDSWKSAFTVPKYRSIEDGASALQNQAVMLGGDAVMNFGCYDLDASVSPPKRPKLICNGNVIQFVQ